MSDYEVRQTQFFARLDRISDDMREMDLSSPSKALKHEIQSTIAVMLPKFENSVRDRLDRMDA